MEESNFICHNIPLMTFLFKKVGLFNSANNGKDLDGSEQFDKYLDSNHGIHKTHSANLIMIGISTPNWESKKPTVHPRRFPKDHNQDQEFTSTPHSEINASTRSIISTNSVESSFFRRLTSPSPCD